jgi:photosystem II stability/assembly factor-like uncharacterized protein
MIKSNLKGVAIFLSVASITSLLLVQQNFNGEKNYRIPGALRALDLWSYSRAYPEKSIPEIANYAAFEFSKNNLRKKNNILSVNPWQSIGPHNMGGRTLALAFNPQNPNTIYAGSASGGLWRSFSRGVGASAWKYVPTGFPILGVSSIVFAPNDSSTIYIGTGEVYSYQNVGTGAGDRLTRGTYGIGILKSTDGGNTWSKSLDWSYNQRRGIWAIKVNPLNSNTVWAATTEGTYKSYNAGTTWTKVHSTVMANDLVINQEDTSIVVVVCGNFFSSGHGLYRTTDAGTSWIKKTSGLPTTFGGKPQLSICESDPSIIFASFGNGYYVGNSNNASWLCKSTDSGNSWSIITQQDYSQYQGWYAHDVAVNPSDPDEVIAVGIGIWKSTNGGKDLLFKSTGSSSAGQIPPGDPEGTSRYSHSDHHDVVYYPTNRNIIYFANDGGIFRSTDGGDTFEGCNGAYQTTQFYNGFSISRTDSQLCMGGLQDNGTLIYRGTTAWQKWAIGGDGCWTAINAKNDSIMFGSWQGLNVLKSTNRGQSFFNIPVPGSGGSTNFVAPFVSGKSNPQIMYAGRDIVYRSTNGGSSWTSTNNGNPVNGDAFFTMAISHQNTNVVYVATFPRFHSPQVFRTLTSGSSWQNITGTLPDRVPGDITVDPNNDENVYITFLGFGSSHVFKSNDRGNNWIDIGTGLPDVPASAIVIDPDYPDHIYIGNDLGIYVSLDGGSSWAEFMEGLPGNVMVFDLGISYSNRKLLAVTHGNGVFRRELIEEGLDVENHEAIAKNFKLEQNYPNPFNPSTTIEYIISKQGEVELKIYDALGKEISTLINENKPPGIYTVTFDASEIGKKLSSGIYIYKLTSGNFSTAKKMILLK